MHPSGATPTADRDPTIEIDSAPGRPDVIWLENDTLRLGAVPALGGRLLSVKVEGTETLWRNPDLLDDALHPVAGHVPAPVAGQLCDWVNYGGDKTWPAPQGWSGPDEWAGPPDPVLDSGPYDWSTETLGNGPERAVRLTMTSTDDPRTGLRLQRRVTLSSTGSTYELFLTATNTADHSVRWSLWNVTQRCGGGEPGRGGVDVGVGLAPAGPTSSTQVDDVVAILAGTGIPRHEPSGPSRVRVPHQDVVGKLGFPTASGWLAHVAGDTTCTVRFDVDPEATYPDGGARAEVWLECPQPRPLAALGDLDPPDRIVEVEVLGPLANLSPGDSTTLRLTCGAALERVDQVLEVTPQGHRTANGWTLYTHEEKT
jgi:Domain of unknown function (DUF4380)